jgi:hypothetical protein
MGYLLSADKLLKQHHFFGGGFETAADILGWLETAAGFLVWFETAVVE